MFGNKDIGMHTGYSWPGQSAWDTRPELCVIYQCGRPESAPVHHRSYAEGGHQFFSELMADAEDEAERDAEAAYDAAMQQYGQEN